MTEATSKSARTRDSLLLALSFAAGYVDALSYLGLSRVFTANMTGNTVLLAIGLAQLDADAAVRSSVALAGFLGGAAAGAWIVERDRRRRRLASRGDAGAQRRNVHSVLIRRRLAVGRGCASCISIGGSYRAVSSCHGRPECSSSSSGGVRHRHHLHHRHTHSSGRAIHATDPTE